MVDCAAELRRISNEIDNHKPGASVVLRRAAAELEAKAAEVARLTAEVERLTPREMTLQEAAKVLSDFQHGDHCLWSEVGGGVVGPGFHDFLTETEARYIAQGLLRDGGKGGA